VSYRKILVVEDNSLNMKLVKVLLLQGGYTIIEATEAEMGIKLAKEHLPDLVLMDVQLPGMDGLTATKIIKEDPKLRGITIVALTSFAMAGDEEKALQAGCAGYLTKPIDTRTFLSSVGKYLL
jgi:CheY-like chemotaxis protein